MSSQATFEQASQQKKLPSLSEFDGEPRCSKKDLLESIQADIEDHLPVEEREQARKILSDFESELDTYILEHSEQLPHFAFETAELLSVGAARHWAMQFLHFAPIMGTNQEVMDELGSEYGENILEKLFTCSSDKVTGTNVSSDVALIVPLYHYIKALNKAFEWERKNPEAEAQMQLSL